MTLTFNPLRDMIMFYSYAKKRQDQRLVGSEDRVETKGRTEAIALPPTLILQLLLQSFYDPLSGTTQVSRYQKDKPFWILPKQTWWDGSGIS